MRTIFSLLSLLAILYNVAAQDLYMPRNIKAAYKKQSRQMDGMPSSDYWQNKARYDITVTAMPPDRTVKGMEKITYFNNSPDTLKSLTVRLFLNIHKAGAPRDRGANPDYLTSGMHIDGLSINGEKKAWKDDPAVYTWRPVGLSKPLVPHDSVTLDFDWHFDVSVQSGREGMIDSTTYFLAYFYPRIAVYDDYNGWDRTNFVDAKEFYSDFNDYTVTVNVPRNYIVWGTGTLQQPETVLQSNYLSRYKQSMTSNEVVQIVTATDLKTKSVTVQNPVNSWRFIAKDIPDMAFGLSDHFVWDAASTVVDNKANRRATANAAYNDTAMDYHQVARYAQHSLNWLSHNWPGVPYPYEKTTVFQGYAGMEYPMMANDETYGDTTFSRFVAEHEIAHTYMPFYMGINESSFGFMDEGWATTFELLIGREDMGIEKAENLYKKFRVEGWINNPAPDQDFPIITPANNLTGGSGFGNNEYGKASLGYLAMKDLLGDELFKKCLHTYMDKWHGKHPLPWDFFFIFNTAAGKNLNWFWSNWYFSSNYIDLALKSVNANNKGASISIDNIGGMAAPFDIIATYTDGSTEKFHQTPAVWEKNQKQTTVQITTTKKIQSVKIDGGIFMDADVSNNQSTQKGF